MRQPLGIIASLLFFLSSMTLWADYDSNHWNESHQDRLCAYKSSCRLPQQPKPKQVPHSQACRSPCEMVCPPPRPQCEPNCSTPVPYNEHSCLRYEPICRPACESYEPCRPLVQCRHPNSNELKCFDGITISAHNSKLCMLGQQYPLEFEIKACKDVCDVIIHTHLPEGVSYIRSQPEAQINGRTLTWDIGSMREGQCIPAKVWLRCDAEGELCACFCGTATPVRFCSILCAKPTLICSKNGPQEVCPGDPVNYTISVTNSGSCAAEDVVITDNVPDGLVHASCLRTLTFRLGTIEPCQTKKVNASFIAEKRGRICNTAIVTACNAESTSCQWCTNVCKECVEITKNGPKEVQIGKNADYQITVTNTGDKPLTEVIITDIAPVATSIVTAPGSCINCNHAMWKLRELQPGEKVDFNVTLVSCTPGTFTNKVSVTNNQGCIDCADFTTHWKGRPALNMQICNTNDPLCIPDTTTYCITVINQGSEADDNVQLVVHFPLEIEPIDAKGDSPGQISGTMVRFAPFNNLRPRQALNYRIEGRAHRSGDGRISAELTSASVNVPIVQQASTIVN